jgi:hypothetical protein
MFPSIHSNILNCNELVQFINIWQNQAHFANLHTIAILNQNGRHRSTKQ